jgi:hypothetical protein
MHGNGVITDRPIHVVLVVGAYKDGQDDTDITPPACQQHRGVVPGRVRIIAT